MLYFSLQRQAFLVKASVYKSFFFAEQPALDPRRVISKERVPDIIFNVTAPVCSFLFTSFGLQISLILDFTGILLATTRFRILWGLNFFAPDWLWTAAAGMRIT